MIVRKKFWNSDVEALLAITGILIVIGMVNVFSSSFILAETDFATPYFFLKKQAINVVVGFVAFLICLRVDYHWWKKKMSFLTILMIVLLIVVLMVGVVVNGSRRWLPVVSMQPSEMAKLVGILLEAAYLSTVAKKGKKITPLNVPFALIIVMAALVEMEPDMGTAAIILGVPFLMMVLAGLSMKFVGWSAVIMAVAVAGLCVLQPYRLVRITSFMNPWADPQNTGYQLVQSLSAIGSGELWGMGLGVGVSKYEYLPEAHTDFAFAIFCQENGFIGALLVFFLFGIFMVYAMRVANRAQDFYGQILALGILILIVGQAIANLFMVAGMFPVVGVPLPFISYGGTSLMVTMGAVGILLNIGLHGERRESKISSGTQAKQEAPSLRLVKK